MSFDSQQPCSQLLVEAFNICVHYKSRRALDHVSFDIKRGEILGLIGPNGAGKSTLVKTLCGHIEPSHGQIKLGDRVIKKGSELHQKVGLVPQDIGLYPHMSAQENLIAFAQMLGMKKNQSQLACAQALGRVGLKNRADDRVSTLSGGMKRRINFAAAIMHRPDLLILDEPTTGIDAASKNAIYALTKELAQDGWAILLITHDLSGAAELCDRLLLLAQGQNQGQDTINNLMRKTFGLTQICKISLSEVNNQVTQTLSQMGFKPDSPETVTLNANKIKRPIKHWSRHYNNGEKPDRALLDELNLQSFHLYKPSLKELAAHLEDIKSSDRHRVAP